MADIFGYNTNGVSGTFKASSSGGFSIAGGSISLVQQWSTQYTQQIQPIYEVGSDAVYFAGRNASGQLTVQRIVGKSGESVTQSFGSICKPVSAMTIIATESCYNTSGTTRLTLKGVIAQSVGWSGNAQNAYVEESVQAVFASMEQS